MRIRQLLKINSQDETRYAHAIACQHARNMSAKKNIKNVSNATVEILREFKKDGDRSFSMEDFNAIVDNADTDEKMFIAERLVLGKGKIKYSLPQCDERLGEYDTQLIDCAIEEDLTIKQIISSPTRIEDAIKFLSIHVEKNKDEKAVRNLAPLKKWYEDNRANRAKFTLSKKIEELEKKIEKYQKKLDREDDDDFKADLKEKIDGFVKKVKSRCGMIRFVVVVIIIINFLVKRRESIGRR